MASPPRGLIEKFEREFHRTPDLFYAPGRVNLIGEHTDYNLGLVLPVAIDLACYAASAPNREGVLRVHSLNLEQSRQWPVAQLLKLTPQRHWSDYVAGVARELGLQRGYDLMIQSTVPLGAGLSSSAALEVATALALGWQGELPSLPLAQLCQRVDNGFLGIPAGIMDQYASVFGSADSAIRLDCRSLQSELVPLPSSAALIVVNSGVHHEHSQSAYRTRVEECAAAAKAMGVEALRDASLGLLKTIPDQVLRRRARHVLTENLRVLSFITAAARGDVAGLGHLMSDSHRSLRDDYEVSCPEVDFLVNAALAIEGVWGARITGGGFGGCTITLLRPEQADNFQSELLPQYQAKFGLAAQFYKVRPSGGAHQLS